MTDAGLPARRTPSRVVAHLLEERRSDSDMLDEVPTQTEADRRALDIVQRTVVSLLVLVMMGTVSAVLAVYLVAVGESMPRSDVIGLWVMTGVVGLLCSGTLLMINRRRVSPAGRPGAGADGGVLVLDPRVRHAASNAAIDRPAAVLETVRPMVYLEVR